MKKILSLSTILVLFSLVFVVVSGKNGTLCTVFGIACQKTPQAQAVSEKLTDQYFTYSSDALASAVTAGQRAVLYFYAPWCQSCTTLDQELIDGSNQLPSDVTIFKVNFDTEKALRRQFNVNYQHTFVLLDQNGEKYEEWIGGGGLEDLVSYLNR